VGTSSHRAYAFYQPFLHAYNPRHAILPLGAGWHLDALAHYPALLGTLAITTAALLTAIGLTYVHLQQRRNRPLEYWAQVGDHFGQYPAGRRPRVRETEHERPTRYHVLKLSGFMA